MVLNKLGIPMPNAINIFKAGCFTKRAAFEVKITHNRPFHLGI